MHPPTHSYTLTDKRIPRLHTPTLTHSICLACLFPMLTLQHLMSAASIFRSCSHVGLSGPIIVELELVMPDVLLTQARLRYLGHLAVKGQALFWAMVQTEQVWWTLIQKDFEWLRYFCPTEPCPCPTSEWNDFAEYVCDAPMRWKSLIKRAVKRSQNFAERKYKWAKWHEAIFRSVRSCRLVPGCDFHHMQGEHYCLQRRRVFESAAACAVHSFKQHDRPTFVREFVTGTACESCLRAYSRHSDLLNHVRYSQDCKQFYCDRGLAVLQEPGVNSKVDFDARGTLPDPVLQAEGPKAMPLRNQGHQSYAQRQRHELWEQWNTSLRASVDSTSLLELLRDATRITTLYHAEITASMVAWSQLPEVVEAFSALNACDVVQQFLDLASASWFLSRDLPTEVPNETVEHFFAVQGICMDMLPCIIPDAPRYKPMMVAHCSQGLVESETSILLGADGFYCAVHRHHFPQGTGRFRKARNHGLLFEGPSIRHACRVGGRATM